MMEANNSFAVPMAIIMDQMLHFWLGVLNTRDGSEASTERGSMVYYLKSNNTTL